MQFGYAYLRDGVQFGHSHTIYQFVKFFPKEQ